MELILAHKTKTEINVTCDGQYSHSFDLQTLPPNNEKELSHLIDDPVAYGKAVYLALFPSGTAARYALETLPERILLVTTDSDLDAPRWEYAYGPDGFLILDCHFVRGLPADQRISPPTLDSHLHVIAVPSNPLDKGVPSLNIDDEWMRLKEIVEQVPFAITLERSRPPTMEQMRHLLANQRHRVVHFMGHGGQDQLGAMLYFEQENGDLHQVTAKQFVQRVRGTVFLVTLNACVSATPGPTAFSNLAAFLVHQKTPYALGMRFSIPDDDARAFSRIFYNELAQGAPVEEALRQGRLTLADSPRPWAIGVPVLYTALAQPVAGFTCTSGTPMIKEHQPRLEVGALPRAEGTFQGRTDELKELGTHLTGDSRPPLVTIHGAGGQGKTALAREAVERFAHAWPGGVWATSLENLPSRELFVDDLARFLGIDTQKLLDPSEVERLVLDQLAQHRTLIVLDNAETLLEAVEANNEAAIRLAQFIREDLPRPPVSLLATSRSFLGWAGVIGCELIGLAPSEGVKLFQQHTPRRRGEMDKEVVWKLSERIEGHPLSLRLLASAFDVSPLSLSAFVEQYEAHLLSAEDKYELVDHRHRTLYASIDISVRYLDTDLRSSLGGLWLFHAPFLPETAMSIFNPQTEAAAAFSSPLHGHLQTLWQRGLLTREIVTARDESRTFYHLLPTIRPYAEHHLEQAYPRETLQTRLAEVYSQLLLSLYRELDKSPLAVAIARQIRMDLERGETLVTGLEKGYYELYWGWMQHCLGNPRTALQLLEQALEIAQAQDQRQDLNVLILAFHALNNMALINEAIEKRREALPLFQQALAISQEMKDQANEAATLNNMAIVYQGLGQPQQALDLYEQALPITRALKKCAGEASILSNMAKVFRATGQFQHALEHYEQALTIQREINERVGEATTLNNMAMVYQHLRQPQRALEIHQQVLPIRREMGDRAGEATTLNNIGMAYHAIGNLQEALTYYEQALAIMRQLGNQADEAKTLSNVGMIHRATGKPQEALTCYQQALSIHQRVGNRPGEATTLGNMAALYQRTGQYQQSLTHFEQALPIMREVGNRAEEAAMLHRLALLFQQMQRYSEALATFEQANTLARHLNLPDAEAAGLVDMSLLLYQHLNRTEDAITYMENSIALLEENGFSQDASRRTIEELQQRLQALRTGASHDDIS